MKRYKLLYLVAGVASVLMTGCNDMENTPSNKFTDNSFWNSTEKAQYVVNMAYSQMYNAGRMWQDESLSDNVFDGRNVTDPRAIRKGMGTPSLELFKNEWKDLYGGIKTCHVFLEKVDLVPGMNVAVKARMIAEIRFIRAFIYFRLTNLYGDVPFFDKDITIDESNSIARTPRATIISFIHQELEDIANALPTRDQLQDAEQGKITKGAVSALQARVYLMDSDWDNVIKYCDNLIKKQNEYGTYSLLPTYRSVFEETNEYNQEIILDRAYVPFLLTWGEMSDMAPLSVGARLCNRAPQQSLVDSYLMVNGKAFNENSPLYNPSTPYANRDLRLTATVVYDGYDWSKNVSDGSTGTIIQINPQSNTVDKYEAGSNKTATGYYTRKYYSPQAKGDMNSGVNLSIIRYADILLMYAEAQFEKGNMDATIWNQTILPLRNRAGFTEEAKAYPTEKTEAEMRQIIRNERRCELALEGLRWYDIKRWKAGKEYLEGYVYGANFNNGNPIRLDKRQFDENRDYLWAVPQSQINLNPNLAPNNPGYSN